MVGTAGRSGGGPPVVWGRKRGAVATLLPVPPAHRSRRRSAPARATEVGTAAAVCLCVDRLPGRRGGARRRRRAAVAAAVAVGPPCVAALQGGGDLHRPRRHVPAGHRLRRCRRRLGHGQPRPQRRRRGRRRRGAARARRRCGPPPRPRCRPVGRRRFGLRLLRVAAAATSAVAPAAIEGEVRVAGGGGAI